MPPTQFKVIWYHFRLMVKTLYYTHSNTRKDDGLLRFKVNTALGNICERWIETSGVQKIKCSLSAGLKHNVHGVPSSKLYVSVNTIHVCVLRIIHAEVAYSYCKQPGYVQAAGFFSFIFKHSNLYHWKVMHVINIPRNTTEFLTRISRNLTRKVKPHKKLSLTESLPMNSEALHCGIDVNRPQGSLQLGGHGGPLNHFEIPSNQKVFKFICFLYIIIRVMWLAPKAILSYQVDNQIIAIITKPSKLQGYSFISGG